MERGLLTSLGKYSPKDKIDPKENFVTEAFAWMLRKHPNFSIFFLEKLEEKLEEGKKLEGFNKDSRDWKTQEYWDGRFPDMVCYSNNKVIIFEHKIWSYLHSDQLKNYRDYAKKYDASWIVLITATTNQHQQKYDLALCWGEVDQIISEYNSDSNDKNTSFIFKDFSELLEDLGVGHQAAITNEALTNYYSTLGLEKQISNLIQRVVHNCNLENFLKEKSKLKDGLTKSVPDKRCSLYAQEWGRIGINFLSWDPGFFIGVLLDGKEHCTEPRDSGPDFCLILNFKENEKYQSTGPAKEHYIKLVESLDKNLNNGWKLYNHLGDDSINKKNKNHPIHIRKPLKDVLAGCNTIEKQEAVFCKTMAELINIIDNEESFWDLREALKT